MTNLKQALIDVHTYNVNIETRDIYVHSYYAEKEIGVDFRQATTFIKNLHLLDTYPFKPILIHLHSTGGCWYNGMAIFDSIKFAKSPIKMIAYAQAMSMSGIILQSSPLRIMMPDAYFMVHQGYSAGEYNHPFAIKSSADFLFDSCKQMVEILAKRAIEGEFFKNKKSTTHASVFNFFDKKIKNKVDWYLTAEEAMFYGLCDGILGSKEYPDVHCLRYSKSEVEQDSEVDIEE